MLNHPRRLDTAQGDIQNLIKCPRTFWGTRQKTNCHEEAKEMWESDFTIIRFFFPLNLLALVEYRFLWIDVGLNGSLSDEQIFNCCKLKKMLMAPWPSAT